MINETMMMKMNELMENEEIAQEIRNTSVEQTHQVLVRNGLEITLEEFQAILADCRTILAENGHITEDGEMSVELLELINGGARVYHCPWCNTKGTNFWKVYGHAIVCGIPHGYYSLPISFVLRACGL